MQLIRHLPLLLLLLRPRHWDKFTVLCGHVTKYQCMQCHGDYDKLAKQTADLVPNPHHSHLGQVNCEDCHKANLSKPVLMCNQCHNFTIRKDGKPIELAK